MKSLFVLIFIVFFNSQSNAQYAPQIMSVDPASLIKITDQLNAETVRNNIIQNIFGSNGLNNSIIPSYFNTFNPAGSTWAGSANMASIEEWRVSVSKGLLSRLYWFKPTVGRNNGGGAFILHGGHGEISTYAPYTNMIKSLVSNGYEVITIDMPNGGLNPGPLIINDPDVGNIYLRTHDDYQAVYTKNFNPLRFFLEPPLAVVNYLISQGTTNIAMFGFSGGGWTTDVYAALDTRIKGSYSLAGSAPTYTRGWVAPNYTYGDWEQKAIPALGADYIDLYVLSSIGSNRYHVNIHNVNDTCCFGGTTANHYAPAVIAKVNSIGGSYRVIHDTTATMHQVTPWAINWIIADLLTKF